MTAGRSEAWAVVPARGGSKSIPLKNLVPLAGRPLIEYVLAAARASGRITRTICSTDHEAIAALCRKWGAEVHRRPPELAGDDVPIVAVLSHLLRDIAAREGRMPGFVCLLQPTSPFVLPEDIDGAIALLEGDPLADSAQTVAHLPHNHHAYNQRVLDGALVRFRFPEERRACYNKQTKPVHYVFGNLVAIRTSALLDKGEIFGDRSLARLIDRAYATDVDTTEDVALAEWLLATGKVVLQHMV